jgi:hypothetical protein
VGKGCWKGGHIGENERCFNGKVKEKKIVQKLKDLKKWKTI